MANPEHVKILLSGVEKWNQWRKENPDIIPDLERAHLEGVSLETLDKNGEYLNLTSAKLNSANLRKAKLSGAKMCRANLVGADLTGGGFCEVDFTEAYLGGVKARGTNFTEAIFNRAELVDEADFANAIFRCAKFSGAYLVSANFTKADFEDVRNFTGADFSGANLYKVKNVSPEQFISAKGLESVFNAPACINFASVWAARQAKKEWEALEAAKEAAEKTSEG